MSAAAQPTPEWTTGVVQATPVQTTGGDATTTAVFTGGDSPTVVASAAPPPQFTGGDGGDWYAPSGSGNKVPAGAIAGGVVGGLAVIAVAVVAIFWIRRRYPRKNRELIETRPVSMPPQYNAPPSNMSAVPQQAHVEEPAYVYKNEGVSAREAGDQAAFEKHVETWPENGKKN